MKIILLQHHQRNDEVEALVKELVVPLYPVKDKVKLVSSVTEFTNKQIDSEGVLDEYLISLEKQGVEVVILLQYHFNFMFKLGKLLRGKLEVISIDEPIDIILFKEFENKYYIDGENNIYADQNELADIVIKTVISKFPKLYAESELAKLPMHKMLAIKRRLLTLCQEDVEILSEGKFIASTISEIENDVIPMNYEYSEYINNLYSEYKENPQDIKALADAAEVFELKILRDIADVNQNDIAEALEISAPLVSRVERGLSKKYYNRYRKYLESIIMNKELDSTINKILIEAMIEKKVYLTYILNIAMTTMVDFDKVFNKKLSNQAWFDTLDGKGKPFNGEQICYIVDIISKVSMDETDPEVSKRIGIYNSPRNKYNSKNYYSLQQEPTVTSVNKNTNDETSKKAIVNNEKQVLNDKPKKMSLQELLASGKKATCSFLSDNEYIILRDGKLIKCKIVIEEDDSQLPLDLILADDWKEF